MRCVSYERFICISHRDEKRKDREEFVSISGKSLLFSVSLVLSGGVDRYSTEDFDSFFII